MTVLGDVDDNNDDKVLIAYTCTLF